MGKQTTCVFYALILTNPAAAFAQPNDNDEIIVSATRTPRVAADVGSTVSIITAEDIEHRQYSFVADALRDVAGVSIARNGSVGGVTSVRIRGAGAGQTLVVIDGITSNDPAAPQGGFNFANLDLVDVERIEVLRGPQSLVYGADAIGGVISITTKYTAGVLAFAEGGSFGTVRGGATIGAGDQNFVRASISGIRTDGISRAANGIEDDGFRSVAASLAAGAEISPTWDGLVTARFSDSHAEIDGFPPPDFSLGDADASEDTQDYALSAQLFHKHARASGHLTISFNEIERENIDGGFSIFEARGDRFGGDYIGEVKLSDRFTLIAGGEFETVSVDVSGVDEGADNGAGFFLLETKPAAGLTISGGVRRDEYSNFEGATTARVAAAWQAGNDIIIRSSWGQGFRAPTLFELNFDQFGFIPNPDLQPERANGFDVSVEWRGRRGSLRTTFFHTKVDDQIDFDFAGSGYFNIDETRSRGVEVEGEWRSSETVSVVANYSFIDAIDKATSSQLLRQPKHSGTAIVTINPTNRAMLSASLIINGDENDFPLRNDAFVRLDLRGGYKMSDNLEFYGRIENLTGANYQDVSGFGEPGIAAFGGVRVRL